MQLAGGPWSFTEGLANLNRVRSDSAMALSGGRDSSLEPGSAQHCSSGVWSIPAGNEQQGPSADAHTMGALQAAGAALHPALSPALMAQIAHGDPSVAGLGHQGMGSRGSAPVHGGKLGGRVHKRAPPGLVKQQPHAEGLAPGLVLLGV